MTLRNAVVLAVVLILSFGLAGCGGEGGGGLGALTGPSTTTPTTPTTPGSNDSITFGCDASLSDDVCWFYFLTDPLYYEDHPYGTIGLELNPGERRQYSEGSETNYGAVIRTGDRYIVVVGNQDLGWPWTSPGWDECSSNGGYNSSYSDRLGYIVFCKRAYIKQGYNN